MLYIYFIATIKFMMGNYVLVMWVIWVELFYRKNWEIVVQLFNRFIGIFCKMSNYPDIKIETTPALPSSWHVRSPFLVAPHSMSVYPLTPAYCLLCCHVLWWNLVDIHSLVWGKLHFVCVARLSPYEICAFPCPLINQAYKLFVQVSF